jgi:hypothetical protein
VGINCPPTSSCTYDSDSKTLSPHTPLLAPSSLPRLRLVPGSSALQQPHEREHPDDVCAQAAVEPRRTLVRPCVRDRRWDGAVVCAREYRVILAGIGSQVVTRANGRRTIFTRMRVRITWYGYVAHSAAIFDEPDLGVCV